jgi:hypothetical protein
MIKGHVWSTDGWVPDAGGLGSLGNPLDARSVFSLGKYATVFQAEVFAILACAHEIKVYGIKTCQYLPW